MAQESMNFEAAEAARQSALASGQEAMSEFNTANSNVSENIDASGVGLGGNLGQYANNTWNENSVTDASNVREGIEKFVDNSLAEIIRAGKDYQSEAESIYKN